MCVLRGHMRRRQFITLLGGAAAWPFAARAQQPGKLPQIGYLGVSSPSMEPHYVEAFRQKLRDLGHVEGKNIAIEFRWAEGQDDRRHRDDRHTRRRCGHKSD